MPFIKVTCYASSVEAVVRDAADSLQTYAVRLENSLAELDKLFPKGGAAPLSEDARYAVLCAGNPIVGINENRFCLLGGTIQELIDLLKAQVAACNALVADIRAAASVLLGLPTAMRATAFSKLLVPHILHISTEHKAKLFCEAAEALCEGLRNLGA